MSTAFLDLVAAVEAALTTPTAVATFIKRGRGVALPESQATGVLIRLQRAGGDQPHLGTQFTDWDTDIRVALLARADAGQDGETAVDALLATVWARLAAATPPAAAANGWALQPDISWDVEEASATVGAAELRLRISHRTADGSLAAAT